MGLAGSGRGHHQVPQRIGPVCLRAAPRHRHSGAGWHAGCRGCGRRGALRGHGRLLGPDGQPPDRRRLRHLVPAPLGARGQSRRAGVGRRAARRGRDDRHSLSRPAPPALRRTRSGNTPRVRRSARTAPTRANRPARVPPSARTGPRSGAGTPPSARPAAGAGTERRAAPGTGSPASAGTEGRAAPGTGSQASARSPDSARPQRRTAPGTRAGTDRRTPSRPDSASASRTRPGTRGARSASSAPTAPRRRDTGSARGRKPSSDAARRAPPSPRTCRARGPGTRACLTWRAACAPRFPSGAQRAALAARGAVRHVGSGHRLGARVRGPARGGRAAGPHRRGP
jgi:hypothetical protein